MSYRGMTIASVGTVFGLAVFAGVAIGRVPPGLRLPTHWNLAGEADRFADATTALILPVLLCAGMALGMAMLPRFEPMQHRLEHSAALFRTGWAGLLAWCVALELLVAAPVFGLQLPMTVPLVATGLLLLVIGNALPKSRPGFFVGIRTPWTLTDPDNWVATHRLGAKTMMAAGGLIALAALLPLAPAVRMATVVAALALAVVPPIVYSFVYWRRAHPGA